MRKIISILLTLAMILPMVAVPVKAEAKTVSSFDELKAAIGSAENGDTITVTSNITLTETLVISGKNIIFSANNLFINARDALTTDDVKNTMFVIKDSTVKVDGLTLAGNSKNRIIYSENSTIELNNASINDGCPGDNSKINPGGGIFLRGGSLTATNTVFSNNKPGSAEGLGEGDGDKNGGAIYSGSTSANITITGGSFVDNEVKAYGHGAAIYQENGTLNVTGTSFKNNKGHVEGGNAGTQGACIHTRDKVTATISGVKAEIAKGFNTGGFLRSWGSDVTVTNSEFKIENLGDGYGYSGGALCFENGKSKVEGSKFTCTGSKLYHAGGFIDIVGGGEHIIDRNTMTGSGKENGQQIASFGGAISVEEGAKAIVTIKDNTIENTSASDNGGAIAIGTHKGKSTPSTVTMSGNTINNTGTLFWGAQHGGAVFVGPDATVTMSNDTITNTRSSYGGGVYNEGKLTITGGSSLTGGVGSKLGGEIYNNGDLIVDDAIITGSFVGGAAWQQYASHGKNFELGGTNIYAEKDVTITPSATITTGKDVRVLDGQSKILLTGALTKEIDVSISEIAGGTETQSRKVGYVVAAGKDGYQATYSDANFLHYIGRSNKEDANHYSNQPRAAFEDDKSTGKWDFVLNPQSKAVVLGQRVKLTLDANGMTETPAKFEDVTPGRDDVKGILTKLDTVDKKQDIYDIYAQGEKLAELIPEPVRKGYVFTGWYKESEVSDDKADKNQSGKTLVEEKKLVEGAGEITTIIVPSEYELYAGWEKVIKVKKVWGDNNDEFSNRPESIKVKLYSGKSPASSEIVLNAENNWEGEIRNIRRPKIFKGYTVKEIPEQYTGYKVGVVTGDDINGFTVTNETEYITIEGSKTWEHGENKGTLPTEVTVTLYENGEATNQSQTGATWKFENLPKYKNKTLVTYTLEETPVDHYSTTKSADGYSFTNTFTNKYKATYEFKSGTEGKALPAAIEGFKPTDTTEYADGATVTAKDPTTKTFEDTTNNGTWTFTKWDANSKTIDKADVKFEGTWTFTENKYNVTYKFESATADKTLPKEVNDLLPTDSNEYDDNTTVTPETLNTTEVTVSGGKWKFKEWTPATATINKANVEFVGKWEFEADEPAPTQKYKVTYKFESATADKTLPKEVNDLLPTDSNEYDDNTIVTPETLNTTEVTVSGGKWKFKEWTPTTATINKADVEFVGKWEFEADKPDPQPEPDPGYWYEPSPPYLREDPKEEPVEEEPVEEEPIERPELNKDDHKIYMFGYPDWTFKPEGEMTRGEAAAMFARLFKEYPGDNYNYHEDFSDVDENYWCYKEIAYLAEWGIINGYEDGTFKPDNKISRAEFVKIVESFEALQTGTNPYSDVDETYWAYKYIVSSSAKGWINGYLDGTFKPDNNISRSEAVKIANKLVNRHPDKDFIDRNKYLLKDFIDLPTSHWAYYEIHEAANGHIFERLANGMDERWLEVNEERFVFTPPKYHYNK